MKHMGLHLAFFITFLLFLPYLLIMEDLVCQLVLQVRSFWKSWGDH